MRQEDIIQAAIMHYLSRALPRESYYAAIPNGFNKTPAGAVIAKATGLRAGAPDLFIVNQGRFFGIEVKTDKGRLTPEQEGAGNQINQAGGHWCVARSVEDVERFLTLWGVTLRARIAA